MTVSCGKSLLIPGVFVLLLIIEGCSSGQKAYQRGDYDQAVLKAINRLQRNPDQKKSRETLTVAYPATHDWHQDNVNRHQLSGDDFRWERIVLEYRQMNVIYNEINRCPGCKSIIPDPASYITELREAKENAAKVRYEKGMELLERARNNRDKYSAREAFNHFKLALGLIPDYLDTKDRLEEARYLATWKVIVEPIPLSARNLAISQEFFENKIQEFLHNMPSSEFVRFYSASEADRLDMRDPDHILALQFDEFVVGQVYLKEREVAVTKDSVILAMIENGKVTQIESSPTFTTRDPNPPKTYRGKYAPNTTNLTT